MKAILFLVAAGLLTSTQPSRRDAYQDANGRSWYPIATETGVVLTTRGAHIHLSRDCKAASARFGLGRWEWANGGFVVIFDGTRIAFPTQEIDVGQGTNCRA